MRRARLWSVVTAAFLLVLTPVSAKNKSKSDLNRLITHAQFAFITTQYGSHIESAEVPAQDVEAYLALERALRKWGRYRQVFSPDQADIVFLVRAGRLVGVSAGIGRERPSGTITIGRRPSEGPYPSDPVGGGIGRSGPVISTGADTGPQDDMLDVYDARRVSDTHSMPDAIPLWRRTQQNGLNGPEPTLLKELRKEVEAAEKEDSEKKK
jgi:hypothetical protein